MSAHAMQGHRHIGRLAGLCGVALAIFALADKTSAQTVPPQERTLTPAQLEKIRRIEIARAAKLYTQIAFSKENLRKMRQNLPLSAADATAMTAQLSGRFEACMEGGFEARLANAYDAQVLRKTMQHVLDPAQAEPKDAAAILPLFKASNAYCSGRVQAWIAAQIK